ncbi:MAG: hypothetical protein RLZZ67_417 [Candidatus Parcubacteria bacterium]
MVLNNAGIGDESGPTLILEQLARVVEHRRGTCRDGRRCLLDIGRVGRRGNRGRGVGCRKDVNKAVGRVRLHARDVFGRRGRDLRIDVGGSDCFSGIVVVGGRCRTCECKCRTDTEQACDHASQCKSELAWEVSHGTEYLNLAIVVVLQTHHPGKDMYLQRALT